MSDTTTPEDPTTEAWTVLANALSDQRFELGEFTAEMKELAMGLRMVDPRHQPLPHETDQED